jgi:hypothetical protein
MKYTLNIARDVDRDEPGVYILNLPRGFRFDEYSTPANRSHVRGYDSLKELRQDVKSSVIACDCATCN